jgi:alanine-synthesizing transaminase
VFSRRTPPQHQVNRLTRALSERRRPPIDLTLTNPTLANLSLEKKVPLSALAHEAGSSYVPDPKGLLSAREAVMVHYAARGVTVDPTRLVLAASSSEAYGWLFKLLADPGDAVLVPAPSYPLLDPLAELESVTLRRYPLAADDGWRVHISAVEREIDEAEGAGQRVAAVVVVNPNNPTGSSISGDGLEVLLALSRERGFGIVSDEVFLDYRFADRPDDVRVAAVHNAGLVFSLGGLSKSAALPQLKLGWILANGPADVLHEALWRLEWIADSYLSVGTPVQLALPDLLAWGERAAQVIRRRVAINHAALVTTFAGTHAGPRAVDVHPLAGGWSAVLRVPAVVPEEDLVLHLLEKHDVLVHPGYFFDFPFEAFLVLSLLPEPEIFEKGVRRLSRALASLPSG